MEIMTWGDQFSSGFSSGISVSVGEDEHENLGESWG